MKNIYLPLAGLVAVALGCAQKPPPPALQRPPAIQQLPTKVELPDVQELMETAEKELAPVDPPSFAPTPSEKAEE